MSIKNKHLYSKVFDSYGEALNAYIKETWGYGGKKKLAKKLVLNPKNDDLVHNKGVEISRWTNKDPEKRKDPIPRTKKEINTKLNISITETNPGKWEILRTENKNTESFGLDGDHAKVSEKAIPYYKEVKPGAGNSRIITPDEESEMVQVNLPRAYITQELKANPSELVIMRVWSDSMEPEIDDGDVIFVSRNVSPPFEGKVYIIRMNESYLCKYLQELPGKRLRVFSENDRYQAFEVQMGSESQEDFEIFGRVIFNGQKR